MTNFQASSCSSWSVFGTTVLLLLVVINIYSAPAAAAVCNSSSDMLFNSSSLEVVEELAKDHEIQRRVLQGGLGAVGSVLPDLKGIIDDLAKNLNPPKKETDEFNNIFLQQCFKGCSRSGAANCACQNKDSESVLKYLTKACTVYELYYCCDGMSCSLCCGGRINTNYNPPSNQGSSSYSNSSSGSPMAYVVMTVIAIFTFF